METITSRNNEKIKLAAALMTSADKRKQTGLFLLEGARLCI
ncbi:MAG: RNA methyltransferase, partial [Clostridiales bacterium]|nr:RNA methyltransferase [Clostridiales bacterium]